MSIWFINNEIVYYFKQQPKKQIHTQIRVVNGQTFFPSHSVFYRIEIIIIWKCHRWDQPNNIHVYIYACKVSAFNDFNVGTCVTSSWYAEDLIVSVDCSLVNWMKCQNVVEVICAFIKNYVKMEPDTTVIPKLSVYYSTISCLILSLIYVGSLYVWRSEHNR